MNHFQMGLVNYDFPDDSELNDIKIVEFYIDGKPLIELLGDCRHLGNISNDLDFCDLLQRNYISQLLGQKSFTNGLTSTRLVLYRCHCACDHCGVFSTEIVVGDQTVEWKLIAWEYTEYQTVFEPAINLTFSKSQYFEAIKQYCEQTGIVL